jgi:hypothetical protein
LRQRVLPTPTCCRANRGVIIVVVVIVIVIIIVIIVVIVSGVIVVVVVAAQVPRPRRKCLDSRLRGNDKKCGAGALACGFQRFGKSAEASFEASQNRGDAF